MFKKEFFLSLAVVLILLILITFFYIKMSPKRYLLFNHEKQQYSVAIIKMPIKDGFCNFSLGLSVPEKGSFQVRNDYLINNREYFLNNLKNDVLIKNQKGKLLDDFQWRFSESIYGKIAYLNINNCKTRDDDIIIEVVNEQIFVNAPFDIYLTQQIK